MFASARHSILASFSFFFGFLVCYFTVQLLLLSASFPVAAGSSIQPNKTCDKHHLHADS